MNQSNINRNKWYLVQWVKYEDMLTSFQVLDTKSFIIVCRPLQLKKGAEVLAYRKETSSLQPAKIFEISEDLEYITAKKNKMVMGTEKIKQKYFGRGIRNLRSDYTRIRHKIEKAKYERPYEIRMRATTAMKPHIRALLDNKTFINSRTWKLMVQHERNSSCHLLNNNFNGKFDLPTQLQKLNINNDDDGLASTSREFSSLTLNTNRSQPSQSIADDEIPSTPIE